jgi:hypothetical protein
LIKREPANGRVVGARCVTQERLNTAGRVLEAGGVAQERLKSGGRVVIGVVESESVKAVGRVLAASCVVNERRSTVGCVVEPGSVAKERTITNGRIGEAGREAGEGMITLSRIGVVITQARALRVYRWRKRKADECARTKQSQNCALELNHWIHHCSSLFPCWIDAGFTGLEETKNPAGKVSSA